MAPKTAAGKKPAAPPVANPNEPGPPTAGGSTSNDPTEEGSEELSELSEPPPQRWVTQAQFSNLENTLAQALEKLTRSQMDMFSTLKEQNIGIAKDLSARISEIQASPPSGKEDTAPSDGEEDTGPPAGEEDASPLEESAAARRLREGSEARLRNAFLLPAEEVSNPEARSSSDTPAPQAWGHPSPNGNAASARPLQPRDAPHLRLDARYPDDGAIRTGKPHSKEPDPFDGTQRDLLPEFLFDLETIFTASKATYHPSLPDSQTLMVNVGISHLRGIAKKWALSLVRGESEVLGSWESFRTALVDQFHDPNEKRRSHDLLLCIQQEGKLRSISAYTIRFEELANLSGVHTSVLREYYWNGLSSELCDILFNLGDEKTGTLPKLKAEAFRQEGRLEKKALDKAQRARRANGISDSRTSVASATATSAGTTTRSSTTTQGDKTATKVTSTELTKYRNPGINHKRPNKFKGCFKCNGDHYMRDCPQVVNSPLNALTSGDLQALADEAPCYEQYIAAMQDSPVDQEVAEASIVGEEDDDTVEQGNGSGRVVVA